MTPISSFVRWWRGGALHESKGPQLAGPGSTIAVLEDPGEQVAVTPDSALQLGAIWLCTDRRGSTVASLPFMVYRDVGAGRREVDRASRLWMLLHDSPNARMTPFDFWRVMLLNHDLRGNAYARIDRDSRTGEAIAMWPMPADQVEPWIMEDGRLVYLYRIDNNIAVLDEANVLHLRNLGNGTIGMDKLEFMRASVTESILAQRSATKTWASSGKPTGVLMLDHVLDPKQRTQIRERFAEMTVGNKSRLYVLEANMKYQQISLTPEQQQLLESRRHNVEDICRWFDVPPVLAYHSNVTTWGSAVSEIVEGWQKLVIRPLLVSIEQAVTKRVLTPIQRITHTVEWNQDALLRASMKDRAPIYATLVQNGIKTRNEIRQLENDPPIDGADGLTAQTNLAPIANLGKLGAASNAATQTSQAQ